MIYTDGTHLVATTLDELHAFASSIGLKRMWFQDEKPRHPHYDTLSGSTKHKAIAQGAKLVSSKEIVSMFHQGKLETLPLCINCCEKSIYSSGLCRDCFII